jgi:hypothetical protein
MYQDTPAWRAHVRSRMRTNAHLAIRHDAYRFMPPGSPRYFGKDVVRYFWPEPRGVLAPQSEERNAAPDQAAASANIAGEIRAIRDLQYELAKIKYELAYRRILRSLKYGYNPNQRRVPAGSREGGQWTTEGPQSDRIRIAHAGETLTDAFGDPYYNAGGHHEMTQELYNKWNLRPETLEVFKKATTGTVPEVSIRSTPDDRSTRHVWDGRSGLHGMYNQAVRELADGFLKKNGITPEQMTPDHARALLKEIRESEDPRIRDFNNNIRRIRRLFRLRPGSE